MQAKASGLPGQASTREPRQAPAGDGEIRHVGRSLKRKEDLRLLTGRGRYVADVILPRMLHAVIVRSPYAHARIAGIHTEAALGAAGVAAVLTFADVAARAKPIPMRLSPLEELQRFLQYPLAGDKVRYVGEPVAVVVAGSRYAAEDAAELVAVDYEPLPAIVDGRAALEPGAPLLHEAVGTNVAAQFTVAVGDVDAAFAAADLVVRERLMVQRHSGVPLETRGLVADFDAGRGLLTVWGPTKVPHFNRAVLADLLDLPEHQIHFIEPDVGGGFGVRGEFYPEDFLIPLLAMRLGRPVQWIEDRHEHFLATNHSREQAHELELAVRADGTILGLRDRVVNDMGAYIRTHGATVPQLTAAMLPGPYLMDAYRCEVVCVLTNKTPTGTYRGPGRFEATFVRERMIDAVAHRLSIDPAEVRRRNFIPAARMPYDAGLSALGTHVTYDSGDYAGLFEKALAAVDYRGLQAERDAARAAGRAVGIGIGFVVEKSGLGPWEYTRIEVDRSGKAFVYSGLASLGQGVETVLAQVCADELGMRYEDVTVFHGDTDLVAHGGGAFASRGTVLGSNATLRAACILKERIRQVAAQELEVDPADLELSGGRVYVRGARARGLSLADVARVVALGRRAEPGVAPSATSAASGAQESTVERSRAPLGRVRPADGAQDVATTGVMRRLSAEAFFEIDHMAYPYGVHLALVEVDRDTGVIAIRRYLIAYDVGRAINPMLVEGQLVGGAAQGIGGSLLEELAYDGAGQLLTASFMDYLLPTAMEVPRRVEVLLREDAPSPLNPLGIKGAGEGGVVGCPAAIANAVVDALGAEVYELPLTPERVRALARRTGGGHMHAPAT
jgi:CO/xanthine dehydrogenase Mo-binding subunit